VVALVFVEYVICGLAAGRRRTRAPVLDTAPPAALGG
jgi:hypothetical protein